MTRKFIVGYIFVGFIFVVSFTTFYLTLQKDAILEKATVFDNSEGQTVFTAHSSLCLYITGSNWFTYTNERVDFTVDLYLSSDNSFLASKHVLVTSESYNQESKYYFEKLNYRLTKGETYRLSVTKATGSSTTVTGLQGNIFLPHNEFEEVYLEITNSFYGKPVTDPSSWIMILIVLNNILVWWPLGAIFIIMTILLIVDFKKKRQNPSSSTSEYSDI